MTELRNVIKGTADPQEYLQANSDNLSEYLTKLINQKVFNNAIDQELIAKFFQFKCENSLAVRIQNGL